MSDTEGATPAGPDPVAALYPDDVEAVAAPDAAPAEKPTEVPAKADEPAAEGVPERYQLELKGVTLDQQLVAEAEPIFRGLGLNNQQANALLPLAPKIMQQAEASTIQRILDDGAKQRKAWGAAFDSDPTIGGANRAETVRLASRGLESVGYGKGHPFRVMLNETGLGNHPDLIRLCRRLGELAGGTAAKGSGDQPAWQAMYPEG